MAAAGRGIMSKQDDQIMRGAKQLARKECANYADGSCLPDDCPCHVLNPAHKTIHDGAVNCDHFIFAVQPQQPELNTAFWHEIYREEDEIGKGWKECARCHKPFIPGSNRQRLCGECRNIVSRAANRERQRRFRMRQKVTSNVTL